MGGHNGVEELTGLNPEVYGWKGAGSGGAQDGEKVLGARMG